MQNLSTTPVEPKVETAPSSPSGPHAEMEADFGSEPEEVSLKGPLVKEAASLPDSTKPLPESTGALPASSTLRLVVLPGHRRQREQQSHLRGRMKLMHSPSGSEQWVLSPVPTLLALLHLTCILHLFTVLTTCQGTFTLLAGRRCSWNGQQELFTGAGPKGHVHLSTCTLHFTCTSQQRNFP